MREEAIDFSDIPRLDDPVWVSAIRPGQTAYHVIPSKDGWAIRRSGSAKGLAQFASKVEAVRSARASARRERTALVVHGRDGSVREFVTFAAESV
jgi:hypothetical protein